MSEIKIYQNKGGRIRWDGKQSPLHDVETEPGGKVDALEFLREDDPRYQRVKNDSTIELVGEIPEVDSIQDWSQLVSTAKNLRDFIKTDSYQSLQWFKPPIDKLWQISLDQFDCTLSPPPEWYGLKKDQLKIWLTKLIEWAESKVPSEEEETEFENGKKVDEDDVPAHFREGGKPNGKVLTSAYLLESDDWCFKNSKEFTDAKEAGRLTRWIKVGRAFAYLYTELAAMNRDDAMKPGA